MKRSIFGTLVLSSFLVSTGRAQVGGSGTPNTIPQFTTATTIGDSPIMQSGGSIGIGANFYPRLPAKLFVVESRNAAPNGGQPYAVFGTISSDINFAAGVRGDASATTGSASGVIGVAWAPRGSGVFGIVVDPAGGGFGVTGGHGAAAGGGGGGVRGQTQSTSGVSSGVRGDAFGASGQGLGVYGQTYSPEGTAGLFINRRRGDILAGRVGEFPDTTVFRVDGTGRVFADGGFRPFGADFAESVPVKGDRDRYAPGDLLVIDCGSLFHQARRRGEPTSHGRSSVAQRGSVGSRGNCSLQGNGGERAYRGRRSAGDLFHAWTRDEGHRPRADARCRCG